MTIKTRNRIYLFLSLAGAFSLFAYTALFIYAAFNNLLESPENPLRAETFFSFNFQASLASILFLGASSPAIAFFILRGFEKTSSLEILFFIGVIISGIAEETRLLIPVLNLWNSSSKLLIFLGRIGVIARVLTPLSLLFSSLFSSSDQLENAERNIFFLFAISCAFGFFYPINSNEITSNCTVLYGMKTLFGVIRILILVTTVITTFINSNMSGNFREDIHGYGKCLGMILFSAGDIVLLLCDSVPVLTIGIILYSTGCTLYLKEMHYMANNWS
ncbi:hypothetical protein [Treponema sp.]|uniref:hypothetical protein n=1 Tax=Treponema sp. TaxID=166 RepID=UPI00298D72FF|nr:hypothetical protein [Treponema sp.]MCQ2242177.1 hypothetical protein [Treponema sp.]